VDICCFRTAAFTNEEKLKSVFVFIIYYNAHNLLYICYKLVELRWKQRKRAYFYLRVPIHSCNYASQDLKVWTKVYKFFTRCRGYIQGLGMCIGFAILLTVIECQFTKWRQGMPVFSDSCHKLVTIATSLQQAVAIWIYCYLLANVNSRSRSLYAIADPSVVCMSFVCRLSVTFVNFVHPTQPVEILGNVSSPFGTFAIR